MIRSLGRTRSVVTGTLLTLALLPAADAGASVTPIIPSGNSGANQYLESVPTAGGSTSSNGLQNGSGSSGAGSAGGSASGFIPQSTQSSLTVAGTVGRQAAALAATTAPARLPGLIGKSGKALPLSGNRQPFPALVGPATAGQKGSTSGVSSVADAVFGGDGVSRILPFVLIATAIGALAVRIARRRNR